MLIAAKYQSLHVSDHMEIPELISLPTPLILIQKLILIPELTPFLESSLIPLPDGANCDSQVDSDSGDDSDFGADSDPGIDSGVESGIGSGTDFRIGSDTFLTQVSRRSVRGLTTNF